VEDHWQLYNAGNCIAEHTAEKQTALPTAIPNDQLLFVSLYKRSSIWESLNVKPAKDKEYLKLLISFR
jgi:hypothetical protein